MTSRKIILPKSRRQVNKRSLLRFLIVGGLGYPVDLTALLGFSILFGAILGSWLATFLSVCFVFILHRFWTFETRGRTLDSIAIFLAITISTSLASQFLYLYLIDFFQQDGVDVTVSRVFSVGVFALLRFWLLASSRFVSQNE